MRFLEKYELRIPVRKENRLCGVQLLSLSAGGARRVHHTTRQPLVIPPWHPVQVLSEGTVS